MAQRVQTVPQPRFQTSSLETTGATIVSTRRVKVPPTIQGSYKGSRDYSGSNLNFITFQLADNECFIDNKCLIFEADLILYGPNAADLPGNAGGRTYGRDLDVVFDQSVDALIAQVVIGSPQGLKWEECTQYNMLANIIALHTQSSVHKERDLLGWSEFSHENDKSYGMQHITDDQWRSPCRIKVGEKTRIMMRLKYSDFMNNMDMIPLFLLRNGLQITLHLESAMKVFYSPRGSSCSKDMVIDHNIFSAQASYLIGPGGKSFRTGTDWTTVPAVAANGTLQLFDNAFVPPTANCTASMYTGSAAAVPSYNTLYVTATQMQRIVSSVPALRGQITEFVALPVTMKEGNTIVWSGWARIDWSGNSSAATSFAVDYYTDQYSATSFSLSRFTSSVQILRGGATYTTDISLQSAEDSSFDSVKQLDIDKRRHTASASGRAAATSIRCRRYGRDPANSDLGTSNSDDAFLGDMYFALPLYSWHDAQPIPYIVFDETSAVVTPANVAAVNNNLTFRGAQCILHVGDAVRCEQSAETTPAFAVSAISTSVTLGTPRTFSVERPTASAAATLLSLWSLPDSARKIRYELQNPQMLLDLVKPAGDDFMRWQQAFSSPSGIPYKYKKTIYRKMTYNNQSSGLLQIQVPINVRSLTGIVFVLQDPALDTETNDLLQNLTLANLSTFQNRRLTEQYIQVGGQQYPVYMYQMRTDGSSDPYMAETHILESEKFFGVAGNTGFNSALTRPALKKTRNMLAGGWLGSSNPINTTNLTQLGRITYTDTSSTVYCMNLAKDWVRTFTTGIDSSQAGSIAVNLYFKDPSGVSNISSAFGTGGTGNTGAVGTRTFNLHMFAFCDAVATLQETACLVRY